MTELTPGTSDTGSTEPLGVEMRDATKADAEFILEMACLVCNIRNGPLSEREAERVAGVLPTSEDLVIIASGLEGNLLGSAWTFYHDPPLLRDALDNALPEMAMALRPSARGVGTSDLLMGKLVSQAKKRFSSITLNVDSRDPIARFYLRSGFKLAGSGRTNNDVAMRKELT
jgi:GNAT superfamily N-acetyltransferase